MITALIYAFLAFVVLTVVLFGAYVAVVCWCIGASVWEMRSGKQDKGRSF